MVPQHRFVAAAAAAPAAPAAATMEDDQPCHHLQQLGRIYAVAPSAKKNLRMWAPAPSFP